MIIHSHLFSNEIIGFGAGKQFKHKSGKQAIYVHDAYPAKALENTPHDRK